MNQTLGTQEILSDVAFNVHFIFAHVAHLAHHIAAIFFPGDVLGESDSNLSKDRVRVSGLLRLCHAV